VHDMLPVVQEIVRDAIQDGLIRTERLRTFYKKIKTLKGAALEDYLQRLWDEPIGPRNKLV